MLILLTIEDDGTGGLVPVGGAIPDLAEDNDGGNPDEVEGEPILRKVCTKVILKVSSRRLSQRQPIKSLL
jgi:hypothetical protein